MTEKLNFYFLDKKKTLRFFLEFQEFMRTERDSEYYEQVDGETEDIYDNPVLSASMNKGSCGKGKSRLTRLIMHPTNQNG